jgi:hypothetical protein
MRAVSPARQRAMTPDGSDGHSRPVTDQTLPLAHSPKRSVSRAPDLAASTGVNRDLKVTRIP